MSGQIVLMVAFLLATLRLIFFGYKLADRGFDAVERGHQIKGWLLFISATLLACGGGVVLPAFGYWLTFNDGFDRIIEMAWL